MPDAPKIRRGFLRGLAYLDRQTAEMYATDDFVEPTFFTLAVLHRRDEFEGWHNEATCIFNLYFMQEPKLQDALRGLITKKGLINENRAIRLFRNSGIAIDKRLSGIPVFVPEIINSFLKDEKERNEYAKKAQEAAGN